MSVANVHAHAGGDGGDDEASLSAGTLSKDQAVALLMDLVGEAKVKELQDEQWKVRRNRAACWDSSGQMWHERKLRCSYVS